VASRRGVSVNMVSTVADAATASSASSAATNLDTSTLASAINSQISNAGLTGTIATASVATLASPTVQKTVTTTTTSGTPEYRSFSDQYISVALYYQPSSGSACGGTPYTRFTTKASNSQSTGTSVVQYCMPKSWWVNTAGSSNLSYANSASMLCYNNNVTAGANYSLTCEIGYYSDDSCVIQLTNNRHGHVLANPGVGCQASALTTAFGSTIIPQTQLFVSLDFVNSAHSVSASMGLALLFSLLASFLSAH